MKSYFLAILSLFLVFSCKQKESNKIIPANMTDTIITAIDTSAPEMLNAQLDDTIHMLVPNGKGVYSAFGVIDSIRPRVYVTFTNKDTGNLNASITPVNGQGNIRFNQIIFPNKTMDGPFGKDLVLELKQTGPHTLIIGHSLMADNPYSGKFKVELQVGEE